GPPVVPAVASISLDAATTLQTMRGWEATAPAFRFTTSAFMDNVVAAGINRVRLEVRAGSENPTDFYAIWQATLGGKETSDPDQSTPESIAYINNWYAAINDDS